MDTTTTLGERRSSRLAILVAAVAALGLSLTLLIRPAMATHVQPTLVGDNLTCAQLGDYDHEFKVEPVTAGTHNDPNSEFSVTLTLNSTANGQTFDFVANLAVDAVFVKGGPGGNLYVYSPAATSDTGLHAPGNDQGTAVASAPWSGLSHLSFCFNDVPGATPTPTPTPAETPAETPVETPAETPAETPEGSVAGGTSSPTPEGSVAGGTGTPAPSQPDTAMGLAGGPSPIPTVAFGLILLAALGALAWANVKSARNRA
jgi:hypothetical protein